MSERLEIRGNNELLSKGESPGSGLSVAPKRTLRSRQTPALEARLASRDLSRVTVPAPVPGAASPAPFFQISRFAPRPSPRYAHRSAGDSASSPKPFSIRSSRSPNCSIPGCGVRKLPTGKKSDESAAMLKRERSAGP